ncbi:MAG: ATP synthase F1 subunit epsilon [Armatimonadota bacterium]|nr:ATP synthase F1 subunit epsilon [Armatimonadota bacterium]
MAHSSFQLSVVAPDKTVVDEVVDSVIAPGMQGYFGILAGHEPFVTQLKPGVVTYRDAAGAESHVFVAGGFCEASGDSVIILADRAEPPTTKERATSLAAAEVARQHGHEIDIVDHA